MYNSDLIADEISTLSHTFRSEQIPAIRLSRVLAPLFTDYLINKGLLDNKQDTKALLV